MQPATQGGTGAMQGPGESANARLAEDPEMREFGMRQTMRDWASFFAQEKLSRATEEMLVKLLVEWTLAASMEDRAQVDRLIAQLLDKELLGRFHAHRQDIPIKAAVSAAVTTVERQAGASLAPEVRRLVDAVVRGAPLNDALLWKEASDLLEAGRLTPEHLPEVEARALRDFERSLVANGGSLDSTQRGALQQWYRRSVLEFNLSALRNGISARR